VDCAVLVSSKSEQDGLMYLISLAGEVVGRLEGTSDALLDGGVTAVVCAEDRVLEASGVPDVDVELAVLALLSDRDARADRGDVRVEDDGDKGLVGAELSAQGALGTSSSSIGDVSDGDLKIMSDCASKSNRG
jgi:hypothetical protein